MLVCGGGCRAAFEIQGDSYPLFLAPSSAHSFAPQYRRCAALMLRNLSALFARHRRSGHIVSPQLRQPLICAPSGGHVDCVRMTTSAAKKQDDQAHPRRPLLAPSESATVAASTMRKPTSSQTSRPPGPPTLPQGAGAQARPALRSRITEVMRPALPPPGLARDSPQVSSDRACSRT